MTSGRGGTRASALLALAVGLILSDSSVVTLALPSILREFDSTVNVVAWVLISFNLALAVAALAGARIARGRAPRAFIAAVVLFTIASLACAAAPSLGFLVGARAAQGLFGAVAVAAALELLVAAAGRARAIGMWAAAGVLGAAVGPAVGGFLTEALSWQAMFGLQAPVALVTLLGARGAVARAAGTEPEPEMETETETETETLGSQSERPSFVPLVALALAAASLSAALFLLVILLIEGWRHSPAEAAVIVTAMPVAALVAGIWARRPHGLVPAIAGSLLVAGGLAALGLLPSARPSWTIVPQLAIGAGLGLALATLIGEAVGDAASRAVAGPAAWTVAARHAGIVVGLLILTPIFTADLESIRAPAERAGLSRVLDAPLTLPAKIDLARRLDRQVEIAADQELPDLDAGFRGLEVAPAQRPALARLRAQLDDELDRGATQAFSRSFLAAALLALLAAAAAAWAAWSVRGGSRHAGGGGGAGAPASDGAPMRSGARLAVAVPAATAAAALLVAAYVAFGGAGYGPTAVRDPCAPRERPAVERTQRAALAVLDGAACTLRTSREELLRTLLDGERPAGVSDDELARALGSGVDRAQKEGELNAVAATALRLGIRASGTLGIIGLILPPAR